MINSLRCDALEKCILFVLVTKHLRTEVDSFRCGRVHIWVALFLSGTVSHHCCTHHNTEYRTSELIG